MSETTGKTSTNVCGAVSEHGVSVDGRPAGIALTHIKIREHSEHDERNGS